MTLNGLTFTGTAEAGTTVRTYGGAVEIGTGLTSGGGSYSITTTAALPDNTPNLITANWDACHTVINTYRHRCLTM